MEKLWPRWVGRLIPHKRLFLLVPGLGPWWGWVRHGWGQAGPLNNRAILPKVNGLWLCWDGLETKAVSIHKVHRMPCLRGGRIMLAVGGDVAHAGLRQMDILREAALATKAAREVRNITKQLERQTGGGRWDRGHCRASIATGG
ncbi:hypothetical protein TNIN_60181 [Trichonephila inaurata madagascariensis]|uniref:Uncharacterized protein n=1 Tax=Trichonephila inaurata madagascariensis TaxID=2747483 RepID=A0A8X6X2M7_9ARAC|nr:hypothetical protein TNIN_60181 [Trichonephila inaurata madagascariensis]